MNLGQLEKKERYLKKKRMYNEAKTEALEHMMETINRGLSTQMELVMLLVLHDKFGFGAERCAKALVAFETLWGDVGENRLSLDDIENTIKEEIGLIVEEDSIYKLGKNDSKIKIWSAAE